MDTDIDPNRISAGELRAIGYHIPENIPDCATISRLAVNWKVTGSRCDKDANILYVDMESTFTESFSWITATITVTPNK